MLSDVLNALNALEVLAERVAGVRTDWLVVTLEMTKARVATGPKSKIRETWRVGSRTELTSLHGTHGPESLLPLMAGFGLRLPDLSEPQREIGPPLRIHRSHPDANFTIIPNATLREERLSALAKSILLELLSHADGWEVDADSMWRRAQNARGAKVGEGRRAYRSAFAELARLGYMTRRKVRNQQGQVVTVLELYDTPGHADAANGWRPANGAARSSDRGTSSGMSVSGTSVAGMSASGTSKRSTNRSTNEEVLNEEHSATLADARVGALASAENLDAKTQAALAWGLVDETRQAEEEREAIINGHSDRQASDAAAQAERRAQLQTFYDAVDRLSDRDLRNALLKFERERKRIYRDSRNGAIDQIREENADLLKAEDASHRIDNLSYKYGLKHYHDEDREWPAFLVRPLLSSKRGQVA